LDKTERLKEIIAAILLRRRTSCGFSQRELAAKSGLAKSYVGQLELAEAMPTIETLIRLALCFEIRLITLTAEIEKECDKAGVDFSCR